MTGISWRKALISKAAIFSFVLFAFLFSVGIREISAQTLTEGFDTVNSNMPEPIPNWVAINRSSPVGTTLWFQGNGTDVFPAHDGDPNSYIGANFNATTGDNTISAWLLTPERTLHNGDVISFWTRTVAKSIYPDRLQVRLSTSGSSTDVGATNVSVGVFTTLLLDINPSLVQGGYPEAWTLETVTLSGLSGTPTGRVALRYFVTNGGPSGANSDYIGVDTFSFGGASAPAAHQESDYNGDGKTDFSIVRNIGGGSNGAIQWQTHINGGNVPDIYTNWGIASDHFEPGDYDGDNKTDVAVWREGPPGTAQYYIFLTGTSTFEHFPFGQTGDDPDVHADYDGDGKADIATFGTRGSSQAYFFYCSSLRNPMCLTDQTHGISYYPFGIAGDFPAPGDYDGDGKADFVIQRAAGDGFARFWIEYATGTIVTLEWGIPIDFVVPGDYDGDGKTDIATVHGSGGNLLWYIRSSAAPTAYNYYAPTAYFGSSATDFTCQGDYDGDGKTDIAVWRPNADPSMNFFYWLGSTSGVNHYPWGVNGDYPAANWNTH